MKLFGHPMSTCTRKALTVFHEKGAPFEFVLVDLMKGEQKTEAHLARQPFGVVPALDDDGFALYESRAMIRYLNTKLGGTSLVPSDPQKAALMDQWMQVEQSYFTPSCMKLVYQYIFNPMGGRPTDENEVAVGRAGVSKALAVCEKWLAKNTYFAGEEFTLADICFMPYVEYLAATPAADLIKAHPNFAAWWGRVSERASWQKATGKLARKFGPPVRVCVGLGHEVSTVCSSVCGTVGRGHSCINRRRGEASCAR